jgi:hypothetical protein
MSDHIDGVLHAVATKVTQWKEDVYISVKLAGKWLINRYAEASPTMDMLLVSAHILYLLRNLELFRKWDKGIDINSEDEIFHTTLYHVGTPKNVETEN